MKITAAKLDRTTSSSSNELARGTVVLEDALVLRDIKLIRSKGRPSVKTPRIHDPNHPKKAFSFLDDELHERIADRLINLFESRDSQFTSRPTHGQESG